MKPCNPGTRSVPGLQGFMRLAVRHTCLAFAPNKKAGETALNSAASPAPIPGRVLLLPGRFAKIDFPGGGAGTGYRTGSATDDRTGNDADGATNETDGRPGCSARGGPALHTARFRCATAGKQGDSTGKHKLSEDFHENNLS